MTGAAASSDYYLKRAEEARAKAASAIHEAVREQYLMLAQITSCTASGRRSSARRRDRQSRPALLVKPLGQAISDG